MGHQIKFEGHSDDGDLKIIFLKLNCNTTPQQQTMKRSKYKDELQQP